MQKAKLMLCVIMGCLFSVLVHAATNPPGIGIDRDEVGAAFSGLGMFLQYTPPTTDGQQKMTAKADQDKALATLEIIGPAKNIAEATLVLGITDDRDLNIGNALVSMMFTSQIMPEWPGATEWMTKAMHDVTRAKTPDKARREIVKGQKRFTVSYVKELGLLFLNVKNK